MKVKKSSITSFFTISFVLGKSFVQEFTSLGSWWMLLLKKWFHLKTVQKQHLKTLGTSQSKPWFINLLCCHLKIFSRSPCILPDFPRWFALLRNWSWFYLQGVWEKQSLTSPLPPKKNGNLTILERSSCGVVCHGKSSMPFTHMPLPVLFFTKPPSMTLRLRTCLVTAL